MVLLSATEKSFSFRISLAAAAFFPVLLFFPGMLTFRDRIRVTVQAPENGIADLAGLLRRSAVLGEVFTERLVHRR